MDKVVKRTFIVVGTSLVVLYLTGIFLPMLISTNTIPVTLILVIATTTIASGLITLYFVIQRYWIEEKLREIKESPDDYKDHIC